MVCGTERLIFCARLLCGEYGFATLGRCLAPFSSGVVGER